MQDIRCTHTRTHAHTRTYMTKSALCEPLCVCALAMKRVNVLNRSEKNFIAVAVCACVCVRVCGQDF